MKKKRIAIIAICLVVVGTVLGIVLTGRVSRETTLLKTALVTRGNILKTVLVDGSLVIPNKAYLSFGVTGTVKEVLVTKGDNVTKGQILARLDAQSLNLSVNMAELQVKVAQQQVNAARAQYEIALINWKAAAANITLKQVYQEQVNIAEANWEAARRSLEIAKLNLETAKLNLEKAAIAAPFDGMVADITIIEGQQISAAALAAPAITLIDPSRIELSGFIDELDVARVKIGQAANITLDALPGREVNGVVSFISPIGTNRAGVISYATTITLKNPSAELRDNMSATAEVIIARRDDVLMIPSRAIQGSREKPVVKVLVDGQIEEREVILGLTGGRNTEVLSGLEEGEKVILPASAEQSYSFFDVDND